jgi:hypothetical protein
VITGKLLAACLVALESFTRDENEKKEEEEDNQKINELSKSQIIV